MIAVIPTGRNSDSYNIIGTTDNAFILQGCLTLDQLKELKRAVDEALAVDRAVEGSKRG